MVPTVECVEQDAAEPDEAVTDGPVVAQVLSVHGALLVGGEDLVRAQEEAEDLGLDADERGAMGVRRRRRRHEAGEVADGVAPLVVLYELRQPEHAEHGVRLIEHPAAMNTPLATAEKKGRKKRTTRRWLRSLEARAW